MSFWMQLAYSLFGIGAFLGPYLVYWFEENSFVFFGIMTAALVPFYYVLPSPERTKKPESQMELINSNNDSKQSITKGIEYCICGLMFLFFGTELTFGGWISSYAVLMEVADKKGAIFFAVLFWTSKAVVTFIVTFTPGLGYQKLKILIIIMMGSGFISLQMVNTGYIQLACYFSSVMYGVSCSSMFGLIMALAIEEGLTIEENQTANILLAGVISEGILTTLVG